MTTRHGGDATPVRSRRQLRELVIPRNPVPGRMGIEWEFLPVRSGSRLVPFDGPRGVRVLLESLGKRGYRPVAEGGVPIGLETDDGAFVGLEPGAQVEISSSPSDRLGSLLAQIENHRRRLQAGASALGWDLVPWGLAPHNGPEDHPDVPKRRYAVLRSHLEERGARGRWMMKLTASIQLSLDFPHEEGLDRQVDGLLRVLPYLSGWLANSPVSKGRRGRWKAGRLRIWRRTDRMRCGMPAFFFRSGVAAAWIRYALSRPLLFLVRDGAWIRGNGRTFGEWLGRPGEWGPVTLEDWDAHLSTLFPDLRLRSYLEIRVLDAVPFPCLTAAAALLKGLFGDTGRIPSWRGLLPGPERSAWTENLELAAEGGGDWRPKGGPAPHEVGPRLIDAARLGLREMGEDPEILDPLARSVRDRSCPADHWFRTPGGSWRGPDVHCE